MTEHGLKQVEAAKADGRWDRPTAATPKIPADLQAAIDADRRRGTCSRSSTRRTASRSPSARQHEDRGRPKKKIAELRRDAETRRDDLSAEEELAELYDALADVYRRAKASLTTEEGKGMRRSEYVGGTLVLAALLAVSAARADDIAAKETEAPAAAEPSPWRSGDWKGERTRLKDRGIDFQFGYTGEAAYNATGGIEERRRLCRPVCRRRHARPRKARRHPGRAVPGDDHPAHRPQPQSTTPNSARCSSCRRSLAAARPPG